MTFTNMSPIMIHIRQCLCGHNSDLQLIAISMIIFSIFLQEPPNYSPYLISCGVYHCRRLKIPPNQCCIFFFPFAFICKYISKIRTRECMESRWTTLRWLPWLLRLVHFPEHCKDSLQSVTHSSNKRPTPVQCSSVRCWDCTCSDRRVHFDSQFQFQAHDFPPLSTYWSVWTQNVIWINRYIQKKLSADVPDEPL